MKLGNAHARDRCGNRLVRAANFRRRCRLQVPAVEVTGSAAHQDKDAGFFGSAAAQSSLVIDSRCHCSRQAQTQSAEPSGLEKSATRDQGGLLSRIAQRTTHRSYLRSRVVVVAGQYVDHRLLSLPSSLRQSIRNSPIIARADILPPSWSIVQLSISMEPIVKRIPLSCNGLRSVSPELIVNVSTLAGLRRAGSPGRPGCSTGT